MDVHGLRFEGQEDLDNVERLGVGFVETLERPKRKEKVGIVVEII